MLVLFPILCALFLALLIYIVSYAVVQLAVIIEEYKIRRK